MAPRSEKCVLDDEESPHRAWRTGSPLCGWCSDLQAIIDAALDASSRRDLMPGTAFWKCCTAAMLSLIMDGKQDITLNLVLVRAEIFTTVCIPQVKKESVLTEASRSTIWYPVGDLGRVAACGRRDATLSASSNSTCAGSLSSRAQSIASPATHGAPSDKSRGGNA